MYAHVSAGYATLRICGVLSHYTVTPWELRRNSLRLVTNTVQTKHIQIVFDERFVDVSAQLIFYGLPLRTTHILKLNVYTVKANREVRVGNGGLCSTAMFA